MVKLEIALVIEDGIEGYLHNAEVDGDMDCDPFFFQRLGRVEASVGWTVAGP